MAKIKFEVPGADTPGYLRRQKKLSEFLACPDDSPDKWEKMVSLLQDYVVSPRGADLAEKALWEMSQNEYDAALALITKQSEVDPNT